MKQVSIIILLIAIAVSAVLSACKEAPTVYKDRSTIEPVVVEISKTNTSQSIIYRIDFDETTHTEITPRRTASEGTYDFPVGLVEFLPAPDPHGDVLIARPVVDKP